MLLFGLVLMSMGIYRVMRLDHISIPWPVHWTLTYNIGNVKMLRGYRSSTLLLVVTLRSSQKRTFREEHIVSAEVGFLLGEPSRNAVGGLQIDVSGFALAQSWRKSSTLWWVEKVPIKLWRPCGTGRFARKSVRFGGGVPFPEETISFWWGLISVCRLR